MGSSKISPSEMELMEILWQDGAWLGVSQVLERTNGQWKYTTVSTFLARLKVKGFVRSRKNGSVNEFCAAITKEEYQRDVYKRQRPSLFRSLTVKFTIWS